MVRSAAVRHSRAVDAIPGVSRRIMTHRDPGSRARRARTRARTRIQSRKRCRGPTSQPPPAATARATCCHIAHTTHHRMVRQETHRARRARGGAAGRQRSGGRVSPARGTPHLRTRRRRRAPEHPPRQQLQPHSPSAIGERVPRLPPYRQGGRDFLIVFFFLGLPLTWPRRRVDSRILNLMSAETGCSSILCLLYTRNPFWEGRLKVG